MVNSEDVYFGTGQFGKRQNKKHVCVFISRKYPLTLQKSEAFQF